MKVINKSYVLFWLHWFVLTPENNVLAFDRSTSSMV